MDHAVNNPQLLAVLGEHIEQGPWYEATIGLDHEGHSASCTFSMICSLGTANLHLQVVKFEGTVLSLPLSPLFCGRFMAAEGVQCKVFLFA
jgi:hypothetical protein